MAQKGITDVKLSQIVSSTFNPRKTFVESELKELSESIIENGVISPIMVRPLKNNTYEIVYGERRYRASLFANKKTIPTIIRSLSDEEAFDLAVTENLQRKDVSPLEEAQAFALLLKKGKNDFKSLALRFGKSEVYIRLRIKLNTLIDSFKELLTNDDINVTAANLLTEYSEETQLEIYNNYFSSDCSWNNWKGLSNKALQEKLKNYCTSELDQFMFDKSDCSNCQFNTANFSLFKSDAACCKNRSCLSGKVHNYILEQIRMYLNEDEDMVLIFNYSSNNSIVERLKDEGFSLTETYKYTTLPVEPEKPILEDYEDEEEFKEMIEDYNLELEKFKINLESFKSNLLTGRKALVIKDSSLEVVLLDDAETPILEEGEDENTMLLKKYENKDKRNKEIAEEKITEDISKLLNEANDFSGDFSELEDNIIYFLMLNSLRRSNFDLIGVENKSYYLDHETKLKSITCLSEEAKTAIKRDYILSNLRNGAFGTNPNAILLKSWARQHFEEEIKEIETTHYDTYRKRHEKLESKIKLIKE